MSPSQPLGEHASADRHSFSGEHPSGNGPDQAVPTVRTREDLDTLFEEEAGEQRPGSEDRSNRCPSYAPEDFAEKLAEVNAIIEPTNCILGKPQETTLADGARTETLFGHLSKGEYDPAANEEKESLPSGLTPAMPWGGKEIGVWTDRHVMLFGRAAKKAFKDTREAQMRRARKKRSPYRKAGLSKTEAEAAEKRYIDDRKRYSLPGFDMVVPTEKGSEACMIGYRCWKGYAPPEESLQVLFNKQVTHERKKAKGVLAVARPKLGLAMRYVCALSPGAWRRGDLEFRYSGNKRSPGLLEVHLRSAEVQPETARAIEEDIGDTPPETLFALISPLRPSSQEKGLWEKIPDALKESPSPTGKASSPSAGKPEKRQGPMGEGVQASMFEGRPEA